MVAEDAGKVVGYVFADIEGTSWMDLRGPCGVVHDIFVDDSARGQGAGRQLMRAAIDWILSRGRTQVVLLTKTNNDHAQRLFAALGFRKTMVEMTLTRTLEGEARMNEMTPFALRSGRASTSSSARRPAHSPGSSSS